MIRKYIVYKVTNRFDGKFYIGCHSTLNTNDRYMGSGTEIKEVLKKYGRNSFVKEILFEYDSKEEMLVKEKELVTKEFCMRVDTYNRIEGGGTYLNLGMLCVKDKEGKCIWVYKDDPRYLSGEFISHAIGNQHAKGLIAVKDKDDNKFSVRVDDPRYLSGELVGHTKGNPQHINTCWTGKNHKQESKEAIGRANSLIQTGSGNSQFGTCWIKKENESKKIKKEDLDVYLLQGWNKGRNLK